MKKYTIEQLNDMNVTDVRKVAHKEFGLALSENGKRFKKGELIVKISSLMVQEANTERNERESKQVYKVKTKLDINNTHTIVAQAKTLLNNARYSSTVTQHNARLTASIIHVKEAVRELRLQVLQGKVKGLKRVQVNKAISLMSVMVQSYERKLL